MGKHTLASLVWHCLEEEYDEKCLVPTFKSERMSVMIWDCIAYNKKGSLIFILKDRRKKVNYVELIITEPLWDFYEELYEERKVALIMKDDASIHKYNVVKKFKQNNSLKMFSHSTQSSNMNSIKHVWRLIKVAINKRSVKFKNKKELKKALLKEWEKIDINTINQLINSMFNRVKQLIKVKGSFIRY